MKGRGTPQEVRDILKDLLSIELYWAYPGRETVRNAAGSAAQQASTTASASGREPRGAHPQQRRLPKRSGGHARSRSAGPHELLAEEAEKPRPNYFEVLFVDDIDDVEEAALKEKLKKARDKSDEFVYDTVVVRTVQDALLALLFNHNIQAVVVRFGVPYPSSNHKGMLREFTRAPSTNSILARSAARTWAPIWAHLPLVPSGSGPLLCHGHAGGPAEGQHARHLQAHLLPHGGPHRAAPHHPARHPWRSTRRPSSPR
jgi:hypothetical protein